MSRRKTPPDVAPQQPVPLGTIKEVCGILKIDRSTFYRLTKTDPILQRSIVKLGPQSTRVILPVIAEFQQSRLGLRPSEPKKATEASLVARGKANPSEAA